jgi:hypothetical protein
MVSARGIACLSVSAAVGGEQSGEVDGMEAICGVVILHRGEAMMLS